ncbi:Transmembrane protein [Parasponia andersonii]|uniref:Transmembrane protein n=1 Tax=Parasponia andersonii TaxID=3476 RepID=A0A2P5AQP5_PARAD|nr:Transmembrane protein [Parasponia andersonii]
MAKPKSNMGFTAAIKAKSSRESWGMGLLLVFFPEDNSAIVDKNKLFSSPSSSPNSSTTSTTSPTTSTTTIPNSVIRRTNSNRLLTKAQSTISICALLVFITLLLFTLSTFEPNNRNHQYPINSRRFLSQNPENLSKPRPRTGDYSLWTSPWLGAMWKQKKPNLGPKSGTRFPAALQGLGTLYRRGSRAMADLVVGHVSEDLKEGELRLFLRLLHRSGLTARADVVFVFGSNSSRFNSVIRAEDESFFKLVHGYKNHLNRTASRRLGPSFDVTQFKMGKKEIGEPLWGKRSRGNNSNNSDSDESESTRLSYGSVLSFEASELDPENSLSGFLDHVPLSMRRWACYPMLLGRVRRNFKHIMLVDVKSLVLFGDPLGLVRNRSPESVFLYSKPEISSSSGKHGKRHSDKTQSHCPVNSAIIAGGARGVRRLSSAMLTEIVRAATSQPHKKRSSLTESGILNQLVGNQFLLSNVKLVKSVDSIPDTSSLVQVRRNSVSHAVVQVQRGNNNSDHDVINSIVMRHLCSSEIESSVYSDC